ncbi:MAG: SIS domain-containing protein, partial [Chloroflexi bacterium]|nr:SIS domain-containing protein [Chloroflexota bacterium]
MTDYIEQGLCEASETLSWMCRSAETAASIRAMVACLVDCLERGGKVLACGNGGSFCDASHLAEELSGRFRKDRAALAVVALSDGAFLTCAANDFGYERVFARAVEALGRPGDVLVVFSSSGNSPSIVQAAETARGQGLKVIGMLGKDGGRVKGLCDHCVIVPGSTTDRIQEI